MTKAEFIHNISQKVKLSKAQTAAIVDTMLEEITALLERGDSISLTGFGTFSVNTRGARQGRNPRTGEPLHIPPSKSPHFKPGKGLKEALKQK